MEKKESRGDLAKETGCSPLSPFFQARIAFNGCESGPFRFMTFFAVAWEEGDLFTRKKMENRLRIWTKAARYERSGGGKPPRLFAFCAPPKNTRKIVAAHMRKINLDDSGTRNRHGKLPGYSAP